MDVSNAKKPPSETFDANHKDYDDTKLSDLMPTMAVDVSSSSSLDMQQKLTLIKKKRLLYGRTFGPDKTVSRLNWPIFGLKQLCGEEYGHHFTELHEGKTEFEKVNNSFRTQLAKSGYLNVEAHLEASYSVGQCASAGVKAGFSNASSDSSNIYQSESTETFIGQYLLPKMDIHLDHRCLNLSKQFESDLKAYLTKFLSNIKQTEEDEQGFRDKYGYWFDQSVRLGGKVYSTKTVKIKKRDKVKKAESDFEASFSAAISTSFGGGGAAGAGIATGNASDDHENKHSQRETLVLESKGGDHESLGAGDWSKWAKGLSDNPDTWEVIYVAKSKHFGGLTEFTDDPTLKRMILQYGEMTKNNHDQMVKKRESSQMVKKHENQTTICEIQGTSEEEKEESKQNMDDMCGVNSKFEKRAEWLQELRSILLCSQQGWEKDPTRSTPVTDIYYREKDVYHIPVARAFTKVRKPRKSLLELLDYYLSNEKTIEKFFTFSREPQTIKSLTKHERISQVQYASEAFNVSPRDFLVYETMEIVDASLSPLKAHQVTRRNNQLYSADDKSFKKPLDVKLLYMYRSLEKGDTFYKKPLQHHQRGAFYRNGVCVEPSADGLKVTTIMEVDIGGAAISGWWSGHDPCAGFAKKVGLRVKVFMEI
eukprot:267692_1